MNPSNRVFAFEDPVEFLNFELHERQKTNSRFSLRVWSRQLGYKNPSYLSHVLTGKRRLKPQFAEKLASDLSLKGRPLRYFELIVLKQNTTSTSENQALHKMISVTRPRKYESIKKLSMETFSPISDWYHWVILEMTELADFDMSLEQIHRRLCGRVTLRTVRSALERLQRAGLLKKNEDGKLVRAHDCANETEAPSSQESVINYFKQMSLLAMEAVAKQPREERDFYGTTLAFRKENYNRALEIVEEAHRQLLLLAEHGKGEEIYQFNTQFFKLTEKKKRSR